MTTSPTGDALPNSSPFPGGGSRFCASTSATGCPTGTAPRSTSTAATSLALPPSLASLRLDPAQLARRSRADTSIPANRSSSGSGASTSERTSS